MEARNLRLADWLRFDKWAVGIRNETRSNFVKVEFSSALLQETERA